MQLISYEFLFAIFLGLPLFHLSVNHKARLAILSALSLFLVLSYTEGGFAGLFTMQGFLSWLPFLTFVLSGYMVILLAHKCPFTKGWAILIIVALFIYIKQYSFAIWPPHLEFIYVSMGLSYVVFRIIQIIMDYSEDADQKLPSFLEYLYHLFAFYTFLSGPIWRFQDHNAQLQSMHERELTRAVAMAAFSRILTGIIKALLIGTLLTGYANTMLGLISSKHEIWSTIDLAGHIALGGFTFFMALYVNFSGYMDIVNGVARLFLLSPPENFDEPLMSKDTIDFWARWHITLSQWFRDYLYYPALMAIMRKKPNRRAGFVAGVVLYFFTFFLLGLWHGASNTFILMGLWLGIITTANKLWVELCPRVLGKKRAENLRRSKVYVLLARAVSVSLIVMGVSLWWLSSDSNVHILTSVMLRGILQSGIVLVGILLIAQQLWVGGVFIRSWWARGGKGFGDFSGLFPKAFVFLKVLVCLGGMLYMSGDIPTFIYQDF